MEPLLKIESLVHGQGRKMKLKFYITVCLGFCHGRWMRRIQEPKEE